MIVPRLQEFLDRQNAIYTHTTHRLTYTARDTAQADHTPVHGLAKTVVFVGDGVYAMAVLPADMHIDVDRLRYLLGLNSVRLASEEELAKLFPDTELGAMPPFGNLYGDIPVYCDSSLAELEEIAFNAGTHRDVVHVKFKDYRHWVHPAILSFARSSDSVRGLEAGA
ncbi:MAG: YbaK/EbsC family protein [Bryobacteraceae bacterium]|nr:YbaK/EbsC family protein [Bryobacteraceae bacterium]MDW8376530.1 YbaK/EbsC family protein [Bryobacterales bacterium]